LKYFFSICLIFLFVLVEAQETTPKKALPKVIKRRTVLFLKTRFKNTEELPQQRHYFPSKTNRYGLRAGVDLYKLTRALYDKDYKGIEFVGDYR
jgi:hypothetical protein